MTTLKSVQVIAWTSVAIGLLLFASGGLAVSVHAADLETRSQITDYDWLLGLIFMALGGATLVAGIYFRRCRNWARLVLEICAYILLAYIVGNFAALVVQLTLVELDPLLLVPLCSGLPFVVGFVVMLVYGALRLRSRDIRDICGGG